ncbi:MAG: glycosyl hydrolase, repeat-containing protein, partial [Pseudonocardiales bacterium]|nr:glycosyl hydrolase, repeat-containing protein [Pseudonocardiales bacterium]
MTAERPEQILGASRRPRRGSPLAAGLIVIALSVAGCTSGSSGSKAGATGTSSSSSASAPAVSPSPSSPAPAGSTTPPVAPGPAGGVVPTGFVPYSVTYVDATHGWALGTAPCPAEPCTSIVRTQNGTSWQGIPAPKATLGTGGATGQLTSLRFADGLNGWAFGAALFSTHDGGATWTQTKIGDSADTVNTEVVDVETSGGIAWAAVRGCATGPVADCAKSTTRLYRSPIAAESWAAVGAAVQTAPASVDTLIARGHQSWLNMAGSLSVA